MPAFARPHNRLQNTDLVSPAAPARTAPRPAQTAHPLLAGQQAWGNQAMQRLLRVGLIQAKFNINEPGDQYEQEADRVAEQVMRMPEPRTAEGAEVSGPAQPPRIQRMCPDCEEELHRQPIEEGIPVSEQTQGAHIQRMCPQCEDELHRQPMEGEEEEILQAKEVPGHTPEVIPDVQTQVSALRGGGRPLPESVRAFFEPRFGHDFSQVRVHTDARAAESARAVNALAYTVGRHVVFGSGQFAPGTTLGDRLLAHELTHVVQQRAHGAIAMQRQEDGAHECEEGEGPPAVLPDPEGKGPHPLVYRGVTKERSRNPSVGDAQQLLNRFLQQLKTGGFTCKPGANVDRIQKIRESLNEDPLIVDCRFGPNTEKATLMFQRCVFPDPNNPKKEQDKEWDGKIGLKTWTELDKLRTAPPIDPKKIPPVPPEPTCMDAIPTLTPATCLDRNKAYCDAASCFPTNSWLACACSVSGNICRAIDAFSLDTTTPDGLSLDTCIRAPSGIAPTSVPDILAKGEWFLSTNSCIWHDWRGAVEAIHDPFLPVPSGLTTEWATAVSVCRSMGVGSKECCEAHVDAEQHAIDGCGPYDSNTFGLRPTDVPGSPLCSLAAELFAPAPFTGDFGKVADRIKFGKGLCCS